MRQFTSKQDFCDWLNEFSHPNLIEGWANQPSIVTVSASGVFGIALPFAAKSLQATLQEWITAQHENKQVAPFDFDISIAPKALETVVANSVNGVKNIIAVTSAKGGVGKSTTAVNLALAISQSGAKVGLLDADIYGPSVPMMMGEVDAKPEVRDNKWMQPITSHGIHTHSIGYLVSKDEAAIWRGPMASKALAQLLNETEWPELDYLVIDMPPGTGDIQLTLSQQIPVTGALIVTTPQDLALADARKGAAMFEKVDVPVIGMVENMSYHICSHCGEKEHIFGAGGAEKLAGEYGLALLAQVPLHISMREDIDKGTPTVAARPDSEHSQTYLKLAETVCSRMYWHGKAKPEAISFTMVE
ncbi:iron-sulfur cluster carrier protein ApbC [Vibrio sp. SCSIO 43135]|uniref:iron-sulfur cluster carrier protein ApbC n=1 Tax=Vibrio sp. SCSIO 43135 TaxID=2819096 RepID=UPI0020756D38|nr:iron-sulfur cluster carrier protein ApbC [Vibrio sp. SCSIO 43135]USD41932.1 iron-sulfur cluster carrier protein ApbC [Vibrio sp. SCSIO 43135]